MDNIFLKIIAGEIPSYKIYEDDHYIAILDIKPKQNGHTLIIPKHKTRNIINSDYQTLSGINLIGKTISDYLMEKLGASGIRWVFNNEKSAGQEVFHTHMHLIPYYDFEQEIRPVNEVYEKLKP